jgi:hypothetical protein
MDILYTDTDQIRGVLFLAPEDLSDAVFNEQLLERELRSDLDSWLDDHNARIQDRSDAIAARVSDLISSYCTYWCATRVLAVSQISVPQQVGDGKNTLKRGSAFEDAKSAIAGMLGQTKAKIQELISGSSTVVTAQISIVGSAIDPVTYSGA